MDSLLRIERSELPRTFTVAGEMDLSNAEQLWEALEPELAGEGDLVLDVSDLQFMDSTGMRTLLQAAASLNARGKLVLQAPTEAVLRLIELMGVEKMENLEVRRESGAG